MANFSTHLLGATAAGVVGASLLAATDLLPVAQVAAGVGVVALGGIFPDVDSDYSDSIELVFSLLGVALGVPVMIALLPNLGLLIALAALGLTYATVRYGVIFVFRRLTVHRGVFHSVPMGFLCACLIASVASLGMGASAAEAWIYALLFFLGFMVHLVLDETYSVDLANRKVKRSFGTALKVYDKDQSGAFFALYGVIILAVWVAPAPTELLSLLGDFHIRLLPEAEVLAKLMATQP